MDWEEVYVCVVHVVVGMGVLKGSVGGGRAYLCPKHVEAIKLHTLSHLVGSLPSLCL
jgi:hypothetical protein